MQSAPGMQLHGRCLQECLEFRKRGRVLDQEQMPAFVAAQLGSAEA